MYEPAFLPVLALALGILIGHFFYFLPSDLVMPGAAAAALVLLTGLWRPAHRLRLPACLLALMVLGIATQTFHRQERRPSIDATSAETVLLQGCVVNPPVFSQDREQFTMELAPGASARITVARTEESRLPLEYGQMVELPARIREPHNYQNPGGFDYVHYLARQNIFWTASVRDASTVRILPGQCGHRVLGFLFAIRTWALDRLEQLFPQDSRTATLLKAILLGESSGVERQWTNDFRLTGTYHALVISGQHVSVLALTLLFLLRIIRVSQMQALALTALASWLYAFISGGTAPVVRAAGGFTLFLIARYFYRRVRVLNLLAVIAFPYLLFDPEQLFDPSFQLSFLSAAAIAVFAIPVIERTTEPFAQALRKFQDDGRGPQLEPRVAQIRVEARLLAETLQIWTHCSPQVARWIVAIVGRMFVFIAEAVLVSACIQFALALPMVTYFHRLSFTGLSANVPVVLLLSLVVPLGFAAILTGLHWLAALTGLLLHCAEAVAGWHARLEPSWRIANLPLWFALALVASSIALAYSLRRKVRFTWLIWSVSLLLFGLLWWQPWPSSVQLGKLELTTIDVGQGESLLVTFPNGQIMLVDAGGFPGYGRATRKPQLDMGEDVVSPYLWTRGIQRIDYAVLTHGHSDHMGGMPAVLENFRPRELWVGAEPESDAWRALRQTARSNHVAIRKLRREEPAIHVGAATVTVLAPSPDYTPKEQATNNDSLVFDIAYGEQHFLLTGDAELPVEWDLADSGLLEKVTVLKVGHHGSRTSSSEALLEKAQPAFALISAGFENQFHHPHPDVLARLASHHAAVYRTDRNGLVTIRTDGKHLEVERTK